MGPADTGGRMTTRRWAMRRALLSIGIALAVACLVAVGLWSLAGPQVGPELDAEVAAMKRDGLLLPLDALFPDPATAATTLRRCTKRRPPPMCAFSKRLTYEQNSGLAGYAEGEPASARRVAG